MKSCVTESRQNWLGGVKIAWAGKQALRALRARLTGRDRDLIGLALDRVLWSLYWWARSTRQDCPYTPSEMRLTDDELGELASIALAHGIDLTEERLDRVFLNRATEHLLARRFRSRVPRSSPWHALLGALADPSWISAPYGLTKTEAEEDQGEEDSASFDERGVHTPYTRGQEPATVAVDRSAAELIERRQRARQQGQIAVLDQYADGPSLWLGPEPQAAMGPGGDLAGVLEEIHQHIYSLTLAPEGDKLDWASRLAVLQAMRRAFLRESVLLRLLPGRAEREESGWGELLAQSFIRPLPGQRESMAHRIAVFLEDLSASSGSFADTESMRYALLDATRLRGQQFVALVDGSTGKLMKDRLFSGFNTPLLPEILVCTSVGQEGIDLHRHCRHVIHYDLAWNPAVLEQRTGRADRIGSKTFRERTIANGHSANGHCEGGHDESGHNSNGNSIFLEIGVPFLAGTYDERMYEELRLRAQTFEVLTGGDFAVENPEGADEGGEAEGAEQGLRIIALPETMVHDLRVSLHVWSNNETRVPAE